MRMEKNVQIVKDFLAALGRRDKDALLALADEHIEWIIPARTGRLPARTGGMPDWRIYFKRLTTP